MFPERKYTTELIYFIHVENYSNVSKFNASVCSEFGLNPRLVQEKKKFNPYPNDFW